MHTRLPFWLFPILLAACATDFDLCYKSQIGDMKVEDITGLIPFFGEPELIQCENSPADRDRMLEAGYRFIGYSAFQSSGEEPEDAKSKARDLHAAAVLLSKTYSHSTRHTIPLAGPGPVTTYTTGTVDGMPLSVTSTTIVSPGISFVIHKFNYFAAYWAKSRP